MSEQPLRKPTFSDVEPDDNSTPASSMPIGKMILFLTLLGVTIYGSWYVIRHEDRAGKIDLTAPEVADLGKVSGGRIAPPIQVTPIGDAPAVPPEELEKKIILLNFWGTWCGPCQLEMPQLDRLHHEMSQEYPDLVRIIAVSYPSGEASQELLTVITQMYAEEQGLTLPLYIDPGFRLARLFEPSAFPSTFLIGPNGHLVHISTGYSSEKWDELMEKFYTLLRESTPPSTGK